MYEQPPWNRYVGPASSPARVGPSFDVVRSAWADAGRTGSPRLVGALGDAERGQDDVRHYYSGRGKARADVMAGLVGTGADAVRSVVKAYQDIGADELILYPAVADPAELDRLAEIVL